VYSLGEDDIDRDSLNHISEWYDDIMKYCGDIPIMIIGNKADLVDETKLDNSYIQEFISENKIIGHYLTSAKTRQGVIEAFNMIIEDLYDRYKSARQYRVRIPVVGDENVGKTSLIQHFTKGSFKKGFVKTTGAQFSRHVMEIEGNIITSLFWDIVNVSLALPERDESEILQNDVELTSKLLMEINDYLRSELIRAGFVSFDVQKTSLGDRITLRVNRPGLVIGKEGELIQEITDVLQDRFGLEMPQIEVEAIPGFFQKSTGAIIVCNLEEDNLGDVSLKQISNWYNEIIKYCGNIPIVVIANKVDLVDEPKVIKSKIQEFVNKKKILGYYITSAKTGQGVNEAFTRIIEALNDKIK
jgi:GTPase SAR1 family protein